jgi:hypothetical protein
VVILKNSLALLKKKEMPIFIRTVLINQIQTAHGFTLSQIVTVIGKAI